MHGGGTVDVPLPQKVRMFARLVCGHDLLLALLYLPFGNEL